VDSSYLAATGTE